MAVSISMHAVDSLHSHASCKPSRPSPAKTSRFCWPPSSFFQYSGMITTCTVFLGIPSRVGFTSRLPSRFAFPLPPLFAGLFALALARSASRWRRRLRLRSLRFFSALATYSPPCARGSGVASAHRQPNRKQRLANAPPSASPPSALRVPVPLVLFDAPGAVSPPPSAPRSPRLPASACRGGWARDGPTSAAAQARYGILDIL